MFYKVIKNQKIIDVLNKLQFVKYQVKNKTLLLCDESEAQGILSSDGEHAWHLSTLNKFPVDIFDTVSIEEIDKVEYERLKILGMKSVEEITQSILLELIDRGIM